MLRTLHVTTAAPPLNAALCQSFDRLSKLVWDTLSTAGRLRMAYGEESLTDQVLLELANNHQREVAIRKFTKHEEGTRTGADWEWWFGDRGSWFGMRVQAKVLDMRSARYTSLAHRVRKSRKLQCDLLIEDARRRNLYPVYCLYNTWDPSIVNVPWRCNARAVQVHQFGCALADARHIRAAIKAGRDDLKTVMEGAVPWTCLPCCPLEPGVSDDVGLAGRAWQLAAIVSNGLTIRGRRAARPVLVTNPPLYVRQMAERQGPLPEPDSADVGRGTPDIPLDGWPVQHVDGVLVVRDLESHTDPIALEKLSAPTKAKRKSRTR